MSHHGPPPAAHRDWLALAVICGLVAATALAVLFAHAINHTTVRSATTTPAVSPSLLDGAIPVPSPLAVLVPPTVTVTGPGRTLVERSTSTVTAARTARATATTTATVTATTTQTQTATQTATTTATATVTSTVTATATALPQLTP